jgi:hypothetical protein
MTLLIENNLSLLILNSSYLNAIDIYFALVDRNVLKASEGIL